MDLGWTSFSVVSPNILESFADKSVDLSKAFDTDGLSFPSFVNVKKDFLLMGIVFLGKRLEMLLLFKKSIVQFLGWIYRCAITNVHSVISHFYQITRSHLCKMYGIVGSFNVTVRSIIMVQLHHNRWFLSLFYSIIAPSSNGL